MVQGHQGGSEVVQVVLSGATYVLQCATQLAITGGTVVVDDVMNGVAPISTEVLWLLLVLWCIPGYANMPIIN